MGKSKSHNRSPVVLTAEMIDKMVSAVRTWIPSATALYVFGSAANGSMNPESDIDLAILVGSDGDLDAETAFQLKTDLAALFKRDVDLVDMLRADDVTRAQVITTGRLVMCADANRCAVFETAALAKYANLNEERREILEDIKKRGSIYGG